MEWRAERTLRMGGVYAVWGSVCWILGVVFAIIGIVAGAIDAAIGLESTSWLLLAVAAFVASIPEYIGWAVAVYLDALKAKKKE